MQKTTFLESMKSGPRSKLELNYESLTVMEGLLSSVKPNHIMINTSYAKEGQNMSQTMWSIGSLLFCISLIGCTGEIDSNYTNIIVDGNELEYFVTRNIGSNSKYIYDACGVARYVTPNQESTVRGLSQDPPEEGSYNVSM